jgi:hypothetical protein
MYPKGKDSPNFIDITGMRFGRWMVVSFAGMGGRGRTTWLCKCDCGTEKNVISTSLRQGRSQSCGCLLREISARINFHHGHSGANSSKEYHAWSSMKQRTTNPNDPMWKNYGARGIVVCAEWLHSFETFLNDMGRCPEGLSLDRKDVNGPYCKSNCRWATDLEQANNTRTNVFLAYLGRTQTLAMWARERGIKKGTLWQRYKSGFPIEEIMHQGRLPTKRK